MEDKGKKGNPGFDFNINLDNTPILYTDQVRLTTNTSGIVLGFGQILDTTNKVQIVARVGMSREHAKLFLNELGKLLAMTQGDLQTGNKN